MCLKHMGICMCMIMCAYCIGMYGAARLWSWCSLGWLLLSGLAQAEVDWVLELDRAEKWVVNIKSCPCHLVDHSLR